MIRADLHTHTRHSHAVNSVAEMTRAARETGLETFGFSEHSPRPDGYLYPSDYQAKLLAGYADYIAEVQALRRASTPQFTVLLGLEIDFMPDELEFARQAVAAHPFDYVIGGLHFQGKWGFDWSQAEWDAIAEAERFKIYARYYRDLGALIESGVAQIIAHPDLIKIYSRESFDRWLNTPEAARALRRTFGLLQERDLIMEISSAGLRKPCAEIYPGPRIMRLAAELGLKVCLSSDAHATGQIAYAFDQLETYAREYGYAESWIVAGKQARAIPF
ncbi:MAG: histidinol-phosphatase [Deltaproteobacteria bacterium]|jgi:histidinol-phosphatase (PHP family)|nr:histidinol-phosphatase [Deltaproteobacteria bacterium]